jgi:hypothetical protein
VLLEFDGATRIANAVSRNTFFACGRWLDRNRCANDPGCLFLADRRHPGTFGQALMAQLVIEALNARLGAGLRPLTAQEIHRLAAPDTTLADREPVSALPAPVSAPADKSR